MTPSPETAAPGRPRVPDGVFALALAVSLLVLVLSPVLTVASGGFLDPRTVADAEPEFPELSGDGGYLALAEVRPEEEPPAASAVVVEELGWDVSVDGTAFTWGASVRNTHGEYPVRFGLQLSVDGNLVREDASTFGALTMPGSEVQVGGSQYLAGDLPSEPAVELEVVLLEWFAFDEEAAEMPEAPQLSARVDAVDEGDEPRGQMRFSVTVANGADHAVAPWLSAVFRRADGTPVGVARVFADLALPPGESVREFLIWKQDVPAGADLSLTEFTPSW
ncbi:hypothetical protein [Glycomyces algeriensis]|uniref:Uncharacterized protein n=1 Tax=Glycomyces algeriensis TaxID=256037 RepID=A0A9W6G4R4_9ACTN|nr:hypothetical protein [Glycomyces algeriensis]MDA1366986.1 hypothetical protein [Glycomyces algeriensis]MDR7352627.1 hypothetical protein [Glycomyces algeriensis]GLI40307.1 hypothetical protein GALLR39Z86_01570 [Glycomyces algeriensis]